MKNLLFSITQTLSLTLSSSFHLHLHLLASLTGERDVNVNLRIKLPKTFLFGLSFTDDRRFSFSNYIPSTGTHTFALCLSFAFCSLCPSLECFYYICCLFTSDVAVCCSYCCTRTSHSPEAFSS